MAMIVATKYRSPRDEGKYDKSLSKVIRENCKIERSYYDVTNANFKDNGVYFVEHEERTKKLNEVMDKQRVERQAANKAEHETGRALAQAISGMKQGITTEATPVQVDNSEMDALKKQIEELKESVKSQPTAETVTEKPLGEHGPAKRTRRTPAEMEAAKNDKS